jgi:hypothetical protein
MMGVPLIVNFLYIGVPILTIFATAILLKVVKRVGDED